MNLKGLAFALRAFLIVFMGGCVSCLWAQSSTTGGLTGTVTDSFGAAVPSVTVKLVNLATNQTQTTTTDANGGYGFSLLPTGAYGVNFSAQGFKTSQLGVGGRERVRGFGPRRPVGGRRIDTAGGVPVPRESDGDILDRHVG